MNRKANAADIAVIQNLKVSDVMSVYRGKMGCACGCQGKYIYPAVNRNAASKYRGYTVTKDEISDKGVKYALTTLVKFAKLNPDKIEVLDNLNEAVGTIYCMEHLGVKKNRALRFYVKN